MFRKGLALSAFLSIAGMCLGQATDSSNDSPQDLSSLTQTQEPPMLGIHWARGFHPFARVQAATTVPATSATNPDLTYHGGAILPFTVAKAIFWGPKWATWSFARDKITGLDAWYSGFNDSNYAKTSDEYTGSNGQVGPTLVNEHYLVDMSAPSNGSSTAAIVAEVCKEIPNPATNGYYPVYVDVPRGNAGYCAYHTYGTCSGKRVRVAFFFDLDGDPGCDPEDASGLHSEGLAALANVSGHELSETRTDPAYPGAWYDASGQENGDKCAWTFNVPLVKLSNGTYWKLQGEWSNHAYNTGTGYPNRFGQQGCLSGR